MPKIDHLDAKTIAAVMATHQRQYLTGHLASPQALPHLDDPVEVGLSQYQQFTAEKPHYHTDNTEYEYVLRGCTKIMTVATGEVLTLGAGDFYRILPNTAYAQKALGDTEILFFKVPGGNDKHLAEVTPALAEWLADWAR